VFGSLRFEHTPTSPPERTIFLPFALRYLHTIHIRLRGFMSLHTRPSTPLARAAMTLGCVALSWVVTSSSASAEVLHVPAPYGLTYELTIGEGALFSLGGAVHSRLGELCIHAEGAPIDAEPDECSGDLYDTGFGVVDGQVARFGTLLALDGKLEVEREFYAPEPFVDMTPNFGRYTQRLTNRSDEALAFSVRYIGSLDDSTWVTGSSAGDVFGIELADDVHWMGTDDWGAGETAAHPVAHVYGTAHAQVKPSLVRLEEAPYHLKHDVRWDIRLDPGETGYLMTFISRQETPEAANAIAEWLLTNPPAALAGLDAEVLDGLLNWSVEPPALMLSYKGEFRPGGYAEWSASLSSGALPPGTGVWGLEGEAGDGPCPAFLGGACLSVVDPRVAWFARVGLDGIARHEELISEDASPGTSRTWQASTAMLPPSTPVTVEVGP
jgi:hypothetical protein